MDAADYRKRLDEIVEEGPYLEVKKDPGARSRVKLVELLRPAKDTGRLSTAEYHRLCPTHFQRPYLFGRPKIHKEGNPLRPIVSMVGTIFAPISRRLAVILSPLGKEGDSYVANSSEVKERLMKVDDLEDGWLVSYDVESLFTKVPLEEALKVVEGRLRNDEGLGERTGFSVDELVALVNFCLTSCYFVHQGKVYIQEGGVAMGSSLSVVVANVYMFHFEELALASAKESGLAQW